MGDSWNIMVRMADDQNMLCFQPSKPLIIGDVLWHQPPLDSETELEPKQQPLHHGSFFSTALTLSIEIKKKMRVV